MCAKLSQCFHSATCTTKVPWRYTPSPALTPVGTFISFTLFSANLFYNLNLMSGTGNWTVPTLFRMREAKKVAAPSESQRASHQRGVTKLPNQKWESSWATTLLLRTRRSSPSQFGLYRTADGLKHGEEWTLWVYNRTENVQLPTINTFKNSLHRSCFCDNLIINY